MIHYDSSEAERLKAMIAEKKQRIKKVSDSNVFKAIQKEILFLENDILPIVLADTNIIHNSFAKYATRCMETAIKYGCNDLIISQHIKTEYQDRPIIGVACPAEDIPFGTDGKMNVCADYADGNGVAPGAINLPIHGLL